MHPQYAQLVADRKQCDLCTGLVNPADIRGGDLDSDQIGPWSLWQGNLNASLMVVGQDWGDTGYFVRHRGRKGPQNPTNVFLVELLALVGMSIDHPSSAL